MIEILLHETKNWVLNANQIFTSTESTLQNFENKFQSMDASIMNLEIQLGQIAKALSNRPNDFFA